MVADAGVSLGMAASCSRQHCISFALAFAMTAAAKAAACLKNDAVCTFGHCGFLRAHSLQPAWRRVVAELLRMQDTRHKL